MREIWVGDGRAWRKPQHSDGVQVLILGRRLPLLMRVFKLADLALETAEDVILMLIPPGPRAAEYLVFMLITRRSDNQLRRCQWDGSYARPNPHLTCRARTDRSVIMPRLAVPITRRHRGVGRVTRCGFVVLKLPSCRHYACATGMCSWGTRRRRTPARPPP